MKTIHLTTLQSGELAHKLNIVADEPDLQDSYEVTEEEARALLDALPNEDGPLTFDPKYEDLLVGELENCLDIAGDNIRRGDASYISYSSSIRQLIQKIKD